VKPKIKSAFLVENQGPAGAGNVIGAGVAFENGEQAAVWREMRREQVDEDKGHEPDCESDCNASGHEDPIPKLEIIL